MMGGWLLEFFKMLFAGAGVLSGLMGVVSKFIPKMMSSEWSGKIFWSMSALAGAMCAAYKLRDRSTTMIEKVLWGVGLGGLGLQTFKAWKTGGAGFGEPVDVPFTDKY